MPYIKNYIFVILMLISYSVCSQNAVKSDAEINHNNIAYNIQQAKADIKNHNYYEAKLNLEKALETATNTNNKKDLGIIYALKAKLQLIIGEEDNAIASLNKAIEIQRAIKDHDNIAYCYEIFGDVYYKNKDYYKALDQYILAESAFKKIKLNNLLGEVLLSQVKTYIKLNAFNKAKIVNEKAILLAENNNLLKIKSDALVRHGEIHYLLKENEKAIQFNVEGLKIAKENNYASILNGAYINLSDINQETGNYKVANDYLRAHIKLADSMKAINHKKIFLDEKLKYLVADKIEENKKQAEALKEAANKHDLSTLISILSVALITILSLLTLSLYKNNNIRLKTNNLLHKKNRELIIAKEKAELASITKANFLSTVTHELRTPLYAVTGLSSMLLDENPKQEQIPHLKSLKFSGDYLLTFINDILQINKIEANKVEIDPEAFNLKKKISNIILALNNSAAENNVKIHFEYAKGLAENFFGDQLKISQILINLIGNSIKFATNGDIWIKVYKIEKKDTTYTLRFEIEDNGIGITKEKQEHMFDSFSQGSVQINRKYGGTGLGLSIVKGLIDILKGKIYVKSELGKGTTFYFEIPLEYTSEEEVMEKTPTYFSEDSNELDLSNVKILIVEDNKINQMITRKILNKMNLKCEVIDNGEDAVELIKTNNYDIVLMDIHMPGISGIEATKLIREFDKELTIFALTAVTIEDKMQEFEEAGFTDIIPKPFKQEMFEKKLYNALASKQ